MRSLLSILLTCAPMSAFALAADWQPVNQHITFIEQPAELRFFESNQVLIQGKECALLVDAPGDFYQAEQLVEKLKTSLKVPLCYLLASHHHQDHLLGLALVHSHFKEAKLIAHHTLASNKALAHQQLNQRLDGYNKSIALSESRFERLPEDEKAQWQGKLAVAKQRYQRWQHLSFNDVPFVPVLQSLALDLGDYPLHIEALGAHSATDLMLWAEQKQILVASDIADNAPSTQGSDIQAWQQLLPRLIAQQPKVVLPGHGNKGGVEVLSQTQQWLSAVAVHVAQSPEQSVEELRASFESPVMVSLPTLASQQAYQQHLKVAIAAFKAQQ